MKQQELITHLSIEEIDGTCCEIQQVRYFVGIYTAIRVNGENAGQLTAGSVKTANGRLAKTIEAAMKRGAKVEITKQPVWPCGYDPEHDNKEKADASKEEAIPAGGG